MARYRRNPYIRRLLPAAAVVGGMLFILSLLGLLFRDRQFPGAKLNAARLDGHIKYLSDDALEGRAVGTRGEQLAIEYIKEFLKGVGFETRLQSVPLEGVLVKEVEFRINNETLVRGEDFVTTTEVYGVEELDVEPQELLFGGFCISTDGDPETYNNFCSQDVRDRIVVCLVNDPFSGPLTYYGRWVYKVEELRRRGAAGVLLVHTDETAGYGWNVLQSPDHGEILRWQSLNEGKPLKIRAWIQSYVAERILGKPIETILEEARFEAQCITSTRATFSASMNVERRKLSGYNVVGLLDGPNTSEEYVLLTAHHDHLGMVERPDGKSIYHGALDNGSGVAKLLELAHYFSTLKKRNQCCKRKLVVVTPTAEEAVLLGSTHYSYHPTFPLKHCVAALNMDGMNVWGQTRDVVGIGAERSTLGEMFARAARAEGQRLSPDPAPEQGLFFRSDQLPFARQGVPAMKMTHGFNYIDHEQDQEQYVNSTVWKYNREIYHQPEDSYEYMHLLPDPFSGAEQEFTVAAHLLFDLLERQLTPKWMPGEPFAHNRS